MEERVRNGVVNEQQGIQGMIHEYTERKQMIWIGYENRKEEE